MHFGPHIGQLRPSRAKKEGIVEHFYDVPVKIDCGVDLDSTRLRGNAGWTVPKSDELTVAQEKFMDARQQIRLNSWPQLYASALRLSDTPQ